jgi:hypothetical protein
MLRRFDRSAYSAIGIPMVTQNNASAHAGEERDPAVGPMQLDPDGLDQSRNAEAVRNVERVADREHGQNVPAITGTTTLVRPQCTQLVGSTQK